MLESLFNKVSGLKAETFQVYYTILRIAFEFAFILKHIFCLPQ